MSRKAEERQIKKRKANDRTFSLYLERQMNKLYKKMRKKMIQSISATGSSSELASDEQVAIYKEKRSEALLSSSNHTETYYLLALSTKKNVKKHELAINNMSIDVIQSFSEIDTEATKFMNGQAKKEQSYQHSRKYYKKNHNPNISKLIDEQLSNSQFSARIWQSHTELKAELQKLLFRAIANGEHSTTLARNLRKKFDVSVYQSKRLVRTEVAKLQIEIQKESYGKNGIDLYEWIIEADACKNCKEFDGVKFKVSEMKIGENAPPIHPNCRCSTMPVVI